MRIFATVSGALVYVAVLALVPISGIVLAFNAGKAASGLYFPVWMALFLALITPFAIIAMRSQVRYNRVRLIDLFAASFKLKPYDGKEDDLVSFEFVRGKYFVDLPKTQAEPTIDQMPRFPTMLYSDWMLLFCALPYLVFALFAVFLLFASEEMLQSGGALSDWLRPSLLLIGGLPDQMANQPVQASDYFLDVLSVGGLAFAGAYFFTLRLFLRAVVAFDLSPVC